MCTHAGIVLDAFRYDWVDCELALVFWSSGGHGTDGCGRECEYAEWCLFWVGSLSPGPLSPVRFSKKVRTEFTLSPCLSEVKVPACDVD